MSVAPSFQNFEFLSEPYESGGKMYIRVRNPKTGMERQVRWYEEKEYQRTYGVVQSKETRPLKDVLGFEQGNITVLKGASDKNFDWLVSVKARYCRWWGWYLISTLPTPELPQGVSAVSLAWKDAEILINKEK
jgi:hypothetical protein